jgi:tetratricopeptide (TPR) repeat protein
MMKSRNLKQNSRPIKKLIIIIRHGFVKLYLFNFGADIFYYLTYFCQIMDVKIKIFSCKVLSFSLICLFSFGIIPVWAQQVPPNSVMQTSNEIVEQINKIGDEAKAKYAENIDKPYIPSKVNPEYNTEAVKTMLTRDLKKYVNYYSASKVPAYNNLRTNLTIKKINNGEVTNDYVRFTSGNENHAKDTVTIYYKDILNYQITYFVKITDNGFYMPYVKVKDHLLTCGGKEVADLLFYMQHQYAVKFYEEDLENFKSLAQKYQSVSEKPIMNEEQRKLFVQGNAMNKQLDYEEAIIYYEKAFALNPVSYPEGYYNYAIIAALAEKYEFAILNMKKYLLLMPNAQDAVSARDKIYEWEALTTRK